MAKRRKQQELEAKMKKLKEERLKRERKERNCRLKQIKERILKYNAGMCVQNLPKSLWTERPNNILLLSFLEWLDKNGHIYGFNDISDDDDCGFKTVTTFTQTTDPGLPDSRVFYVPDEVRETKDTGTQVDLVRSLVGDKEDREKDSNEHEDEMRLDHVDDGSKGRWKGKLGGHRSKRKRKAVSSANVEDEEKEAEKSELKYGVCPVCSRNYGKDLWRHLRKVEKWTEEQIKTTYKNGKTKIKSL